MLMHALGRKMERNVLLCNILLVLLLQAGALPEYAEINVKNEAELFQRIAAWKGEALNYYITSTQPKIVLSKPIVFTEQHADTGFYFNDPGTLKLECGAGVDTAIIIRSSGVMVGNVDISGCNGSAIISELPANLTMLKSAPNYVQKSSLSRNQAKRGGALRVNSGFMRLDSVTFTDNSAIQSGGAVYVASEALIQMQHCVFDANHALEGGAVCLDQSRFGGPGSTVSTETFQIRDTIFSNNTAVLGGGALAFTQLKDQDAQLDGTLQVTACQFSHNKASRGGAVWSSAAANVSFEATTFVSNLAADGGAMWVKSQTYANVAIQKGCIFSKNVASDAQLPQELHDPSHSGTSCGGALYGMGDLLMNITAVTAPAPLFINNQADADGGAFYCAQCLYILLNGSRWESNRAVSGGAVSLDLVTGTSFITRSTFKGNSATDLLPPIESVACGPGGGGALCVKSISQNFTLTNNTFESNRGNTGGALFVNQDACQLLNRTCGINVVHSRFIKNTAQLSGGAVHSSDVSGMRSQCLGGPAPSIKAVADVLIGCSQLSEVNSMLQASVDTLRPGFENCGNTFEDNQVLLGYGPVVSTRIYCVLPTTIVGRSQLPWALAGNSPVEVTPTSTADPNASLVIANDQPFQVLFRHYDYFLQRVNIDLPLVMLETVSTPDLAVLAPIVNITKGAAQLNNVSVFGQYGNHLVTVLARDGNRSIASVSLKVQVRKCKIGEVTAGRACRICETDTQSQYSFDPHSNFQACEQCPDGAKCQGWSIIPNPGYWHSSPRSPQVHRCILQQACDYSDRFTNRSEILRGVQGELREYSELNSSQMLEYNSLQCARGYEGNLCGNCASGYGKRGNRCLRCAPPNLARLAFSAVRMFEGIIIVGVIVVRLYYRKSKSGSGLFKTPGLVSSSGKVVGMLPIETVEGPMSPIATVNLDNKAGGMTSLYSIWSHAGDHMAVTFEILIIYLQVLALLKALPLQWPRVLYALLSSLSITEASVTWISVDCLWPDRSHQAKAIMRAVLSVASPGIVWGCIMMAWTCWYTLKHRGRKSFRQYMSDAAILSAVQVITYYYPSITSTLLSVLTCKTLDVLGPLDGNTWRKDALLAVAPNKGWWMQNLDHQCWTGSHYYFALGFGIPALVVVAVVVPVCIVAFLVRARIEGQLESKRFYIKFGYLYTDFRTPVYYWYTARFTLMLVLTGVVQALSYFGPLVQVTVFTMVLTIFVLLHVVVLPYKDAPMNTAFLVAMVTLLASCYACFAFVTTGLPEGLTKLALNVVFISNTAVMTSLFVCLVAGMVPYVSQVGVMIKAMPEILKGPEGHRKDTKIEAPKLINVQSEAALAEQGGQV